MRRATSLLLAALAFALGGLAVERVGLAADPPKSKQQVKREQLKTLKAKQAAKQKAFLTMVFGGPANYSGLDMRKGHQHLVKMGLNDSHVDVVIELLGETLTELGVPNDKIAQVAAIANSVRDEVLDRPKAAAV